jgi:large subunit ribosomal protein L29
MKAIDIRKMKTEEIVKEVSSIRTEIAELKRRIHMGETQNMRIIRAKRRDLARMLTVMTEQIAKEAK